MPEDAQNKVKVFLTLDFIQSGQNIILAGNPGTGKTHKSYIVNMNKHSYRLKETQEWMESNA